MSSRLTRSVLTAFQDSQIKAAAFKFSNRRLYSYRLGLGQRDRRGFHTTGSPFTIPRSDIKTLVISPRFHSSARASSFWTLAASFFIICGGFAFGTYLNRAAPANQKLSNGLITDFEALRIMSESTPTGHLGNLTPEQETKLKEFWGTLFKIFGVTTEEEDSTPILKHTTSIASTTSDAKKPKRRLGFFGSSSPKPEEEKPAEDDKFGQIKEYQDTLASRTPEELRIAFWQMVKQDHPDSLLLRFLRARKWDVNRATIMFISALNWRSSTICLEEKVMKHGDIGALEGTKSSDPEIKQESEDFMDLLRLGESYLHGKDKQGRPICYIRVKLHKIGAHSEASLQKYTVYLIETSRMILKPPMETAALVFDMTDFSLANLDYTPIKFMIQCFEANYPESLGVILVHKAPWLFSGIWSVIKGWLDPVVASKVHFTKTVEDLEPYISRSELTKEVGGDNPYEYKYIEPEKSEDSKGQDTKTMDRYISKRFDYASEFQKATKSWMATKSGTTESTEFTIKRDDLAARLHDNYWQLDPYVRARSLYDRLGVIQPRPAIPPSRTVSIRTTLSEKASFEVVATRQILVEGENDVD